MKSVPLSSLKPGQSGTIVEFTDEDLGNKLMEMNCLPGEAIVVKHIAPLGDPMMISVAGYSLGLRKAEAETVMIRLNNETLGDG